MVTPPPCHSPLGKLNNHLGLHYASMGCFALAEKHFTQAMNLCAGECFSIRKRAVLLQNLGAVYSALDQYGRSLEYHSQAADIYGKRVWRASQRQTFEAALQGHVGQHRLL